MAVFCDAKSFFFYDAAQFQCAVFAYRLIGSTSIIYACLVNILSRFFCIWFGKIKIESIKLCVIAPSNRNSLDVCAFFNSRLPSFLLFTLLTRVRFILSSIINCYRHYNIIFVIEIKSKLFSGFHPIVIRCNKYFENISY